MKRTIAAVLAFGLFACPCFAGDLRSSATKAMAEALAADQRIGGAGNPYLVPGLALAGGGAALAILGVTALKTKTLESRICRDASVLLLGDDLSTCNALKDTNQALLWTGVGVAALGGTLLVLGRGKAHAEIRPVPGGFGVFRTIEF